jgi:hypothetical protein
MGVVLERVLPSELAGRGVADAEGLCRTLASAVSSLPDDSGGDTPDMVFQRLGGGA